MTKSAICIVLFSVFTTFFAVAQQDTIIDNKPYAIHVVQARETLYGISRQYNAELNDLVVSNPAVIKGLQVGFKLLVPLRQTIIQSFEENTVPIQTDSATISSHNIQNFNNTNFDSLKPPINKSDSSIIRVALLLPFYLDINDSLKVYSNNNDIVYPKSKVALDFYFGFKLAIDSLTQLGYNIDLMVLDVPNDSIFKSILNSNILFDREYIFGPIYIRQFEELAKFYGYDAKKKLISPLSYRSINGSYQNVYQSVPRPQVQLDTLINYMILNYRNDPIIILGNNKEKELYSYSVSKLKHLINQNRCVVSSFDEKQLDDREFLKTKLNSERNVILIPSNDRSFVSWFLPILSSMDDTSFTVFGLDNWNRFDNLDYDDLDKLNVHLTKSFGMKTNKLFNVFLKKYIDLFQSYPTKYSFSAYLQAINFLSDEFGDILHYKSFHFNGIKSNHTFDIIQYIDYQQVVVD